MAKAGVFLGLRKRKPFFLTIMMALSNSKAANPKALMAYSVWPKSF
jgi:hypothetical protein